PWRRTTATCSRSSTRTRIRSSTTTTTTASPMPGKRSPPSTLQHLPRRHREHERHSHLRARRHGDAGRDHHGDRQRAQQDHHGGRSREDSGPVKSGWRVRARGTRGFTLIEVLVALSLAGIVLASLVPLLVASVHGVGQSRRLTTASGLAQAKLEEIRNTAGAGAGGSDSVDATGRGETYTRAWAVG